MSEELTYTNEVNEAEESHSSVGNISIILDILNLHTAAIDNI